MEERRKVVSRSHQAFGDLKYRLQKLIEDGNAKPFNTNFCNLICISVR